MDGQIIAGKTVIEHDERLIKLMKRIDDFGFHLKIEKSKIGVNQLDFLGKVVKKEGISPHPEKVRAIKKMPKPENLSELRSFLGAVNHYSQYGTCRLCWSLGWILFSDRCGLDFPHENYSCIQPARKQFTC
jgi:hypothetical protein